ncbi:MAG: ATP-binding protein [bacterium]
MNSPFRFGTVVDGESFTDRENDIKRLRTNFLGSVNTILVSPRKWGKSSLVKNTARQICRDNPNIKFCFIDLFKTRSEREFFQNYTKEIIKSTSSKSEEIFDSIKRFLKNITPKFSLGIDPMTDFEIEITRNQAEKNFEDILDLPEKIADEKNIKIIICLDEFQNISNFKEPLNFQKQLRSVIQHHKKVNYCFYGSKKEMMIQIFEKRSMPFFKFGDLFLLDKIDRNNLIDFVEKQFLVTGKKIERRISTQICALMQNHPYYVQQLSHIVWSITEDEVTSDIFDLSVQKLLDQNSLLFEKEIEGMGNSQINFLKAVCDGITDGHSRKEVLFKYDLGTSANSIKIRRTLYNREIIDINKSVISFIDPAFEYWFKTKYM